MTDVMMAVLVVFVLFSLNVLPSRAAQSDQGGERRRLMLTIDHDGSLFVDGTKVAADELRAALLRVTPTGN